MKESDFRNTCYTNTPFFDYFFPVLKKDKKKKKENENEKKLETIIIKFYLKNYIYLLMRQHH